MSASTPSLRKSASLSRTGTEEDQSVTISSVLKPGVANYMFERVINGSSPDSPSFFSIQDEIWSRDMLDRREIMKNFIKESSSGVSNGDLIYLGPTDINNGTSKNVYIYIVDKNKYEKFWTISTEFDSLSVPSFTTQIFDWFNTKPDGFTSLPNYYIIREEVVRFIQSSHNT